MPTYLVTAPDGRKLRLTGDAPPTDEDLDEVFANLPPAGAAGAAGAAASESPFANVTPVKALLAMNPLTSVPAVVSMAPESVKRAGGEIVDAISGYLQVPREQTTDRLARAASRLVGYDAKPETGPDGRPRQVTAPELLERGLMPERTPGGRATSKQYREAADAGDPFAIAVNSFPFGLGTLPGLAGDVDEAVAKLRSAGGGKSKLADAIEVGEDLARVPARMVMGAATDPATALGATAIGRSVGASTPQALARLSRVDQALAGTGAAVGATGAARETEETRKALERGEYGKAAEHGLGALLQAGMAGLGARGVQQIGAARTQMAPSGGRKYIHDPLLTAEERAVVKAQLDAEQAPRLEAERLEAEAATLAQKAEESAALGKTGKLSPQALAEDAARAQTAKDAAQAARQGIEESSMASGDAARAEGEARAAELGDLPEIQNARRVLERAGSLKPAQKHLEAIPNGGEEVAGRMRAAQFDEERLGGAFWGGVRGAMEDVLPGNSRAQGMLFAREVAPVLDGTVPVESVSPAAQAAVAGIKPKLDAMYEELAAAYREHGLEPPPREEAYLPRIRKGQSLTEIEAQARELAQKERATVEDAAYAISVAPRAKLTPEQVLAELRAGEKVPGTSGVIASRADRVRRFEKERVPNQPLHDFRTDLGVLEEYGSVMARRIAELKHFGRNGEALQALIDRMPDTPRQFAGLKVGDRAFAQTLVDRVRGVLPITVGQQGASIARTAAGVQGLVFAPTQQPLSLAQIGTMSIRHPVAAAKGIQSLLFDGIQRGDLKSPVRLAKAVRQSWRRADIKAEEVGAITKRTSEELASAFGIDASRTDTVAGKVAAVAERAPWIGGLRVGGRTITPGLVQADRALRIIAKNVGDFVVPRMVAAAKKGSASEQKALAYMGIDWKGYDGSPAELAKAVKFFADETNYRPNILRLPPQASSPLGRFGFQFASFMHSHTRFMGFLARNPERLAAFAALGLPLAHASNQFRFWLKGTPYEEKPVEDVQKGIADAMAGKSHPDWTKGTKEALVALGHATATLGVGAIYQAMVDRTDSGKITDLIPILRSAERIFTPIAGAKESTELRAAEAAARAQGDTAEADRIREQREKLEADTGTKVLKAAVGSLPQVPLPGIAGSPNEVVRELTSDVKPAAPGWFGRLRDKAEERGLVRSADPSQSGSAGRANVKRLADLVAERSKARGQGEAMLADAPTKTVDEKLVKAEKSALREKYRLAIIEALAAGDHVEAMRLRQEARRLKIKFGRKALRSLDARVYRPDEESDQEENVYP